MAHLSSNLVGDQSSRQMCSSVDRRQVMAVSEAASSSSLLSMMNVGWPLGLEAACISMRDGGGPVQFLNTYNPPYFSDLSATTSDDSEFDTESHSSESSSFCKDSRRITLASLIGLPLDSFRYLGDTFRIMSIQSTDSRFESSSVLSTRKPRRRSCGVFRDFVELFICRVQADFGSIICKSSNVQSFSVSEISQISLDQERSSTIRPSSRDPKLFINAVYEESSLPRSKRFEWNPLFVESDVAAASGADSLDHESHAIRKLDDKLLISSSAAASAILPYGNAPREHIHEDAPQFLQPSMPPPFDL
ncbi:unnamed protein product [Sphagnum jensenii]|uniref:Uncharacterized protein n=1 Tax=Sphagnum jensenii TaxID=128206 RepID=A0ABP1BIP5_9BRYO